MFVEAGRRPWILRHECHLAGFVMVRELPSGTREVAEFLVVRTHRRPGVGRRAARLHLAGHPGRCEMAFDAANAAADAFWPGVVDAVATGAVEQSEEGPPVRTYEQIARRFATS